MVVTKGKRSIISLKANIVVGQSLLKLDNYGKVFFDSIMFLGFYGNSWCNHVTRRRCWGSIQKNFFSKNLHENRVYFSEERNAFVLDHEHGCRDITFKLSVSKI